MAEEQRLRLRAADAEDMDVVAALLQDALVPVLDMTYQKRERRFVMVANRFRWRESDTEDGASAQPEPLEGDASFEDSDTPPAHERINTGVRFDKVVRVQSKGISDGGRDQILNLLTVVTESKSITLLFSEDAVIRLDVEEINCHLEDVGDPWPTRWRPHHDGPVEGSAGESDSKAEG